MNNFPSVTDLDLEFVKNYLRVDYDFDDNLINMMIFSSQSYIQGFLNQKFTDFEEVPAEFTIAALTLISQWYEKRAIQSEGAASNELKHSFGDLLSQYRNFISEGEK